MSLTFKNAKVLWSGGFSQEPISMSDDRIVDGNFKPIDLSGYLILPGIVDMHGDAFDHHIAPRPSAPLDISLAFPRIDIELASNGITTAWLAKSWSWEGGRRSPEHAKEFAESLDKYRLKSLTDLRLQLRCEAHTVDSLQELLHLIKKFNIDYLVFNNHLSEAMAVLSKSDDAFAAWAAQVGNSFLEQKETVLRYNDIKNSEVHQYLLAIMEHVKKYDLVAGSHDDPDKKTRRYFSELGAKICEFPLSIEAANEAKSKNDPVLMGAPNVLRGGSQSGNIAAKDLIKNGLCDVLVSDYYYPSLYLAALKLVRERVLTLEQSWDLISRNPARIMRLDDVGELAFGKRANMVIVDRSNMAIEATVSKGKFAFVSGKLMESFIFQNIGISTVAA
ncbi:MAG: alpha-D-ribose 1-methylphosphonate 5-triphosphate diphosphatase [Paracoccaceae bacterium]|jgi:alpha-D-ribose 1-methylphosphonate 5-triphosphate diphosphatase